MEPEAQTPESLDETTERRPLDPTRTVFSRDQQIGFIVKGRFNGQRPKDLSYPNTKFKEDGKEGETVETTGAELRRDVSRLFDRLEGKIDAAKLEALKASFESSLAPWKAAGLFSDERLARGYRKPDFEKDYKPLITVKDAEMMYETPAMAKEEDESEELDKGYSRAVWAPEDVPVASEDAETLTYLKLLEEALLKAFHGTAGGKKPNTLLVGPDKKLLIADKIDLENILYQWGRYEQPGIVYNPKELDPKNHGGQSEAEMLASLQGTEKETGGVLRLERDDLIMPRDVWKRLMSGKDWHVLIKEGKILPPNVRAQDVKQALAYVINCLNTQGWVPDFYDWNSLESSKVVLAPETYIPDGAGDGVVPAFHWSVNNGQFAAGGSVADTRCITLGFRGGVRKNKETA
ncbi:hypothetical protein M0P48_04685 [Candidatus Gracilibacteria bacterium]|nr:hypothetical protein [Candidatus Gracilibacteria bacterium]